jgi:hypothetical protein
MATRITLTNGEQHVCRESNGSSYVDLNGDWIDKDNPAIAMVEHGSLVFVPDQANDA